MTGCAPLRTAREAVLLPRAMTGHRVSDKGPRAGRRASTAVGWQCRAQNVPGLAHAPAGQDLEARDEGAKSAGRPCHVSQPPSTSRAETIGEPLNQATQQGLQRTRHGLACQLHNPQTDVCASSGGCLEQPCFGQRARDAGEVRTFRLHESLGLHMLRQRRRDLVRGGRGGHDGGGLLRGEPGPHGPAASARPECPARASRVPLPSNLTVGHVTLRPRV